MDSNLTTDQKIELLKIAATTAAKLGHLSGSTEETINAYKKLVEVIAPAKP